MNFRRRSEASGVLAYCISGFFCKVQTIKKSSRRHLSFEYSWNIKTLKISFHRISNKIQKMLIPNGVMLIHSSPYAGGSSWFCVYDCTICLPPSYNTLTQNPSKMALRIFTFKAKRNRVAINYFNSIRMLLYSDCIFSTV